MLKYLRMSSKRTKAIWWALIVLTIGTFVGGFIFLFGSGFGGGEGASRAGGAVAVVNGREVSRAQYQEAIAEQREAYQRRFNTTPADQDARIVEAQAWRSLVTQQMLGQDARRLGLNATNREVVLALQTSPPSVLAENPQFQTDGKFDPEKYRAALGNPNNNWAPLEEMMRSQLPLRKLQERLATSIKLSQPELREAFRNEFERIGVTAIHVPPQLEGNAPAVSDADLDRVYQQYRGRFTAGARTELEVLSVPRKYSEEELRAARETAVSLVERARRGEDFAALARDYSEGPGAERGGVIDRVIQPNEFGPLAPQVAAMQVGQVSDPLPETGRFILFKILERVDTPPTPGVRVAQIVIKARPSENSMREQLEDMKKARARAKKIGLGRAATERGLATSKTPFFDLNNPPPQLFTVPEAADWAVGSKVKDVSPVFESLDEFVIVQVTQQRPPGPATKAEVMDQLRRLAEYEARTAMAKPTADRVAQALASGQSLEQAAQSAGQVSFKVEGMSRQQPDPRLGSAPEIVGAVFAAPIGKVFGPIRTGTGWYFARVDQRMAADSAVFNNPQIRGQLTSQILQRKQGEFFSSWVAERRLKAKVQDLRQP